MNKEDLQQIDFEQVERDAATLNLELTIHMKSGNKISLSNVSYRYITNFYAKFTSSKTEHDKDGFFLPKPNTQSWGAWVYLRFDDVEAMIVAPLGE